MNNTLICRNENSWYVHLAHVFLQFLSQTENQQLNFLLDYGTIEIQGKNLSDLFFPTILNYSKAKRCLLHLNSFLRQRRIDI